MGQLEGPNRGTDCKEKALGTRGEHTHEMFRMKSVYIKNQEAVTNRLSPPPSGHLQQPLLPVTAQSQNSSLHLALPREPGLTSILHTFPPLHCVTVGIRLTLSVPVYSRGKIGMLSRQRYGT